jgi:hypothetical protein
MFHSNTYIFRQPSAKQTAYINKRYAARQAYQARRAATEEMARVAAVADHGEQCANWDAPINVAKKGQEPKFVMNFPMPERYWDVAKADRPTTAKANKRDNRWQMAAWGDTARECYAARVTFEADLAAVMQPETRPCITGGRQPIEGVVVNVKLVQGLWDDDEIARYTIDLDDGNRVYGKLHETYCKGDRVKVSACIKPSDDDHFGLMSRSQDI